MMTHGLWINSTPEKGQLSTKCGPTCGKRKCKSDADRIGLGAETPGSDANATGSRITDYEGVSMTKPTRPRTTVRRNAQTGLWIVDCPCGFVWGSRLHRLALLLATEHVHRTAA